MNLVINAPDDLGTDETLVLNDIPCYCRIAKNVTIEFRDVFCKDCFGVIKDFDREIIIESEVSPLVGGPYYFIGHSLVSLHKESKYLFKIKSLKLFCSFSGWQAVYEQKT